MRTLIPAVLLAVCGPAAAADRTHAVTVDDYFTLATITEIAASPDRHQVAYCEARWDAADDARKSDLWVVGDGGPVKPKRLTGDRANDRHPKWAADGSAVFVLGNRKRAGETKPPFDGKTQVWRVPVAGGDPQPVTRVEGGVSGYDLAGDHLFYSVDKKATDDDPFAKLRGKFALEYGHGKREVSEIWRLDMTTWRAEKLVDEGRYVREFAAAPDGKRLAMVSALDDTVLKSEGESRVDVWDEGSLTTPPRDSYRATASSPHAWLEGLAWSPDGTWFALREVFDAHPAGILLGRNAGGWGIGRVRRPADRHVRGYGSPLCWTADNTLHWLGEQDGSVDVVRYWPYRAPGPLRIEPTGQVVYAFIPPRADQPGAGVAVRGKPDAFPVLSAQGDAGPALTYDPNPHTAAWKLPTVKHIYWTAADGSKVGGVLELPYGYDGKAKLPLVVAIHGGPTTSTKAALEYDPHNGRLYFAAHGYAVLLPNYRGSTGYGDKFVTDLIGRENDLDVSDIVRGVQHLIKEGIADPDRVGVMGWSNGGYLTNCLITRTDLPFKLRAASSGAGIVDATVEWGTNDEPAYVKVFKKGHPWETPDIYRKASPAYALGNVTAPTLIHVGGNDERCPPGHSRMLYRALREYVKVPTELVVYPGEPHGLTKMSHRRAKMEWDLAWFDKYLKTSHR
jgi:dipeptidyl aminopeptidase/acylaminoacyl peptidase